MATKEKMIEKWVQNSRFVNKRWGAIAYRVKNSIEYLLKISNLSLKELLKKIEIREYKKGEEENTFYTLYIFITTAKYGSSKYPKYYNVYLTLDREFIKAKKQKELFPQYLVCLDSNKINEY